MRTSVWGAAYYDQDVYADPASINPRKSGGPSFGQGNNKAPDNEFRTNDSFFKSQKQDTVIPERLVQTKSNEQYSDTDFLITPLLPTVKRNINNKLALHLENEKPQILTK
jgi:hypothetical protein